MPFQNREISWLKFNSRVLEEANKPGNPVLERLNFLAITASNLDEFFMVRVAYLYDRKHGKGSQPDEAGMSPEQQLDAVLKYAREFVDAQYDCLGRTLADMRDAGIYMLGIEDLDDAQLAQLSGVFYDEILPVLTPLAVDPSRPFPFLFNKSLNIAARMTGDTGEDFFAVVQVPSILPRFLPVPMADGSAFLPMEQLIKHHMPEVFGLYKIEAAGLFRITRSADFDVDEDADDLLEEMERTIKRRKRGRPIRLELSADFDPALRSFIVKMLAIGKQHIFEARGLLDLSALSKVAGMDGGESLRLRPILPAPAADFAGEDDLFAAIRERDRLVHHPYESFNHVVDFIKLAADDPDVLAIKQTLYRVSGHSQIVAALERAAEGGKQVTVLVELKARFDEENNIQWAKRLERAGCHVIYGVAGLKTHCKVTLVVRRERGGIRRYLHMSTGNYNDITARLYTDIGMFTCRNQFGSDASALFNHLTGYSREPEYAKLVVAPHDMKRFFLTMMDNEISHAKNGRPSGIIIKVNSLLDAPIVRKLYEASCAGVRVRLLVRGICSLIPGARGYSENIEVHSIVGQLLEHSRIFHFVNGGDNKVYLGSADLMPRNLDRRVELVFPVDDENLRARLIDMLDLMWNDNANTRIQGADGDYRQMSPNGKIINSQQKLSLMARGASRAAHRAAEERLRQNKGGM